MRPALDQKKDLHNDFHIAKPIPVPSLDSVIWIIQRVKQVLFPEYFDQTGSAPDCFGGHQSLERGKLVEVLSAQIALAVCHEYTPCDQPCARCTERFHETAFRFAQSLFDLKAVLAKDICAALEGDPAAKSHEEIVLCYPGFFAITVYRIAHKLHELGVPLLPRMMTEYAHSLTGIDIHPGSKIGESFFIDHGTGVVVGETTVIGNQVRLYQGVTLGALSVPRDAVNRLRNRKRHPTVEDDVIIYSNATILGGDTIIGARSIIGGNVWITESVPPDTKVLLKSPELVYIGNSRNVLSDDSQSEGIDNDLSRRN